MKGEKIMKKFVYQVGTYEWVDTEAWGWAWREAKAEATKTGSKIYRLVIKNGEAKQQVFHEGGCFLNVK